MTLPDRPAQSDAAGPAARPAATLHLLCGKPGAGKSTLAASLAATRAALRIDEDVWIQRLYEDALRSFDDYLALSRRLRRVVGPLVVDVLAHGRDVVLDAPANTSASRTWMRSLAADAGAAACLHWLDTPDDECLRRIARRNRERPEGSHVLTEADFTAIAAWFQPPGPDEGVEVVVHRPGSGIPA